MWQTKKNLATKYKLQTAFIKCLWRSAVYYFQKRYLKSFSLEQVNHWPTSSLPLSHPLDGKDYVQDIKTRYTSDHRTGQTSSGQVALQQHSYIQKPEQHTDVTVYFLHHGNRSTSIFYARLRNHCSYLKGDLYEKAFV